MSGINIAVQTLLADATVAGIVGDRVYPVFPGGAAALPFIIVGLIHESDPDLLQGAGKLPESRVSIASIGDGNDYDTLHTLGRAVIDAMQDKTEYAIAGCIATIRKEGTDVTDQADQLNAQNIPQTVRRITDFYITWRDA